MGISDRYRDVLDTMGSTFVCGKNVNMHVAEPKAAWQAMLELNDGGMSRLTKALRGVAHLDFKLKRLQQQLLQCRMETGDQRLGRWYEKDGDGQIVKKQAIAKELWQGLSACSHSMGELIERLVLPTQELNNIYLSIRDLEQAPQTEGESPTINAFATSPFGGNPFADNPFASDPFATTPVETAVVDAPATAAAERVGQDDDFAHQAFKAWVAHLRELPQQPLQWRQLGMSSELINQLSEELITAATRLDLEGTLKHALAGQEQAETTRVHMRARQVLRAQLTIRDFIAWFSHPASRQGTQQLCWREKQSVSASEAAR